MVENLRNIARSKYPKMSKTNRTLVERVRVSIGGYLFISPVLIFTTFFIIYPVLDTVWMSLHRITSLNPEQGWLFVGLSNYIKIISNPRFLGALIHTIEFTAVSVSLEFILGLGMALVLNSEFRGRSFVRTIAILPWAVPTAIYGTVWGALANAPYGLINDILMKLNLIQDQIVWLSSPALAMLIIIAADVWNCTPFMMLLMLGGLQGIPKTLYEAAKVDGASSWSCFRHITLPLLKPFVLLALLYRTMDAYRVFDIIYVMTRGGPADSTESLSIYGYKLFFRYLKFDLGSTVAVVLFLTLMVLVYLHIRQIKVK